NIDLDIVNRQFFFDAQSFLGPTNGSVATPPGLGAFHGGGSGSSSGSTNSSDLFLYDDSSDSGSNYSYGSDQENNCASKE
ncbi:hypothetical protein NL492_27020, partial [Klebsiella pneumoniae]|nr:hypothetical protein [Klebsiella pneumoniae]